jgi:hypothetical protein
LNYYSQTILARMPRLGSKIFHCIFYLYRRDPRTGELAGPCGTGSLVLRPSKQFPNLHHYYGVTNWHVVNGSAGASIIRLNTKNGATRFLEYDPMDWSFVANGDDLAAIDLTADLSIDDETNVNPEDGFVTEDIVKSFEIGPGEDVFMGGLYPNQSGGQRNRPCVRFGNIAMMPDRLALVKQPNGNMRPSYLADMRSRSGFSGAPVFIYRTPHDDLSGPWRSLQDEQHRATGDEIYNIKDRFLAILGIHCGQYWERIEVSKSDKTPESGGDPINDGDELYVQGAMTIIVPAWRISELLDLEIFETRRRDREQKWQASMEKLSLDEVLSSESKQKLEK